VDDRQRAKFNMYIVVRGFLNENPDPWSGIPKFLEAKEMFGAELTKLEGLTKAQKQPTTGVTTNKTKLRQAMGDAAMPVVGALLALAADQGDSPLAAEADYTRSDFVHGPEIDGADNADVVHDLAVPRAAALVDFGLTQAAIDTLDTAITAYRAKIGAPRLVKVSTTTVTKLIAQSFTAIDFILENSLDKMAEVIRPNNETFYLQYKAAREIIDPGSASPPGPARDAPA
jgi:hypothetical protein